MMTFLEVLKQKIIEEINPEKISIVDNSDLHKTHKSFDSQKYHLKIFIKSKKLNKMNKIDAHKIIFSILKEEMKKNIHALEIEIN